MTMESANGSCDRTMGLLPNLWVIIGECDVYLQVQIIESALFEMLLGCLFFTLAQASTWYFFSGDSHITLLDPNSVMNIEWDYSYYQPWSDNEWLVDEMMAMQEEALMAWNEDITMQWCIEYQSILGDNGLVVWTRLFWKTLDYFLFYFWTCAKWDNIRLIHY